MMRIRAETNEVPSNVVEAVKAVSNTARRSISLVCLDVLYRSQSEQFSAL